MCIFKLRMHDFKCRFSFAAVIVYFYKQITCYESFNLIWVQKIKFTAFTITKNKSITAGKNICK